MYSNKKVKLKVIRSPSQKIKKKVRLNRLIEKQHPIKQEEYEPPSDMISTDTGRFNI
tara:strand:- start:1054 stop:1224 length:171 start_codon:yes stop_codon:yes gene_type:complete